MIKNLLTERTSNFRRSPAAAFGLEMLEGRQLLHGGIGGHILATISFNEAPSAVQTGLNTLASTDSLAAPASDQTVYLGNRDGVESYSLTYSSSGTNTRITVDVAGNPVTAPTQTSTTFGAVGNSAVTDEFNAIASALGATAPASTDVVKVTTPSGGTAVYSMRLITTGSGGHTHGISISVDANGNPVGNERIPFSAIPGTIQNGLNANAPSGATPIDTSSTQGVNVRTANGVTTYSVRFTGSGTTSTVTVDAAGQLANLPSTSKTTFSTIPVAAQTELQTLATSDGATGSIDTAASVRAYDEANGTIVYSVSVAVPNSANTGTHHVTISVDENGNPTVPPNGLLGNVLYGGTFFGGGMFHGFGLRGHRGLRF